MAITEACQVWIEQRISEELTVPEVERKSHRAIAKEIAQEIERIFEAKVKAETISRRIDRVATNVAPKATAESANEKSNNKLINETITKKGTPRKRKRGGGRKPKSIKKKDKDRARFTSCYESFLKEVQIAKINEWKSIKKEELIKLLENILSMIEA